MIPKHGVYFTLTKIGDSAFSGSPVAVSAMASSTVMGTAASVGIHRLRVRWLRAALNTATVTTTRFAIHTELPEGKTAEVLTDSLDVALYGTAEALGAVSGGDLLVIPDLSGYTAAAGDYTVPADVEVTSGADVGVSGDDYQVRVRILEETGE